MKNITITIISFLIIGWSQAQENYTKSLDGIKKVKIGSQSGVDIKVHNKKELLILGREHKIPEKAKGLKPLYAGGEDNTGLGMYIKKEGETLIVRNLKNGYSSDALALYLPKDVNITIEKSNLGGVNISGFSSEIEVSTNVGRITLTDVTGPIVAKTSAGEINVIFDKVSQKSPISLVSSAGVIDVSLPSNTSANLELKTTMGEIFTDFDIKFPVPDKDMQLISGKRTIKTELNNGGVEISLRSSVGNIYLRKK